MKLKKRKKLIIIIALLLAVICAAIIWKHTTSSDSNATTLTGSIDTVEKRSIANSVSGSGTIVAGQSENISADVRGLEVLNVYINENDNIEAGTIIASLDTSTIDDEITDIYKRIDETNETKAERDEEYDDGIKDSATERTETIQKRTNSCNDALANRDAAQKNYDETKASLEAAEEEYDAYKASEESDPLYNYAKESALYTKVESLKTSLSRYETEVKTYQTQADSYYDEVQALSNEDDDALVKAKEEYDEEVDDIIAEYWSQIDELNEEKSNAVLKAHVSGVVTSLNIQKGDTYSGGIAATIKSDDDLIIETTIDEYDIADVAEGMNVLFKTDATRDDELKGVVIYVAKSTDNTGSASSSELDISSLLSSSSSDMSSLSSMLGSSSSSSGYLVKVQITDKDERLRLGMSARVSILTEEANDALSVPYDAVQYDDEETAYINVVTNGKEISDEDFAYKKVNVVIGMQGSYYVEINSNEITEGTKIYVPSSESESSVSDILSHVGSDAGV